MMALKTQTLGRYLLISLAIIFSAMVITGCGGGGGDSSSTSGTPNIGLVSSQTDFGAVVLGKTADKHIEIWNTGSATLSIGQITQPAGPFSMIDTCSGENIPRNSKCVLTVHFAPNTQGDYNGGFEISSNDSDQGLITATLTGRGRALATAINRVVRVDDQTLEVIVSVRDQNDLPVTDLVLSDFTIVENNGSPITPTDVSNTVTPGVSVGIVLDYSSSMLAFTGNVEVAAKEFVDHLNPAIDEAEVLKFATEIEDMVPGFTQNPADLYTAIDTDPQFERIGTSLYLALLQSIEDFSLESSNSRRAIISVSDGKNDRPPSVISDVTAGATENNVQIFTIGIGNPVDNVALQTLAADTGGQYFYDPTASDLSTIYSTISEILGNEYTITYTTSSAVGSTIFLKVMVNDSGQLGETSKTVTL